MKAIYRGHEATITECMGNPSRSDEAEIAARFPLESATAIEAIRGAWDMDGAVLDDELWVSFMDPDLIVDPTDIQMAAARAGLPIPLEES
jgi:hypothetical protein